MRRRPLHWRPPRPSPSGSRRACTSSPKRSMIMCFFGDGLQHPHSPLPMKIGSQFAQSFHQPQIALVLCGRAPRTLCNFQNPFGRAIVSAANRPGRHRTNDQEEIGWIRRLIGGRCRVGQHDSSVAAVDYTDCSRSRWADMPGERLDDPVAGQVDSRIELLPSRPRRIQTRRLTAAKGAANGALQHLQMKFVRSRFRHRQARDFIEQVVDFLQSDVARSRGCGFGFRNHIALYYTRFARRAGFPACRTWGGFQPACVA